MSVIVRDYRPDELCDAERLAAMFNDFDSAWPGGFTRGTVETAESTRAQIARMRRLAILVAEDTASGDFVGYCDLDAQPGQKDKSYVGLLGARLSVHGKGIGKALIREAIKRAADAEYREVTLYTWAGNTKAVPLYKKTGFNWVPDTDVYMRNFIPSVLAMPIVRAFLGDRDWYDLHERDLTVAPDDITWKGMKVYTYRFRKGEDYVQLTYQADSAGLTAIETSDFSVSCTVPVEEAAVGQTYPVVWEIESRRGKALDVVLLAEADAGLDLAVQERVTVTQPVRIAQTLRVSDMAMPRRDGERTHLVRSTLLIDGHPLTLETGVKVVRPIEIQYEGQGLLAGRDEKITVSMRNRLHSPIDGTLALDPHPALKCSEPIQSFQLPPRSWTQCEWMVTASQPGTHSSHLRCHARTTNQLEDDSPPGSQSNTQHPTPDTGQTELSSSRSIVLRAFTGGETLASIDIEDSEKAILESLDLRVEISLRGGRTEVLLPDRKSSIIQPGADIGPPFGSNRMRPPLYTARIEHNAAGPKLRILIPSLQVPGLTLERAFSLMAGGVVRIEQRVVNSSDQAQPAQIRIRTGAHMDGYLAAPSARGLVREPLQNQGEFPAGDTDIVGPVAQLTENWIALEEEGRVAGLIWQGAPPQDVEWARIPNLTYDLGDIPPHSAVTVPTYWAVASTGDWKVVRSWWRRLVQPSGVREPDKIEPARVLSLTSEPSPVLLRDDRERSTLTLHNLRGTSITGSMRLAGSLFNADPSTVALAGVNRDNPLNAELIVTAPEAVAARYLDAEIDGGVLTESLKLPVVRLTAGTHLEVSRPEPRQVVIDNGYLTLRFATGFYGALTALETGGVNHLLSAWPEPKPFIWMNPWFGGVHPFNHWMGDSELARESFTGEPVQRTGERGWQWEGVKMSCDVAHKDRSWQRVEIEYLTLPGSNVLALVLRYINRTDARMSPWGGVAAWAQPGGTRGNTILHWERHGERRVRRRGGFAAEGTSGRWVAVENPESRDSLILIATDPAHSAAWEDFGVEGPHLQARGPVDLGPYETQERIFWLVHCKDMAQADAYGASLSQARRLP